VTVDDFDAVTTRAAERFTELLATADLETQVPACPGWTVRDLAEHLGEVHRWAAYAVTDGSPDAPEVFAPKGHADLVAWYRESAEVLLQTLRRTPADAPAWHFGPKPRLAGWWWRRQAHEITVHLHDLGEALGRDEPIDARLAADGIDEVIGMFFPRQVRLGRIPPLTRSLAVVATDVGGRQVLAGDGTAIAFDSADATLAGPASLLYLALWKRVSLDHPGLAIDGDRDAAAGVLAVALTP